MLRTLAPTLIACTVISSCAPAVKRSGGPPAPAQMAELWVDPGTRPRDLFVGAALGGTARPERDARYEVLERDARGFSITYRVRDSRGQAWHVKIGPEAQSEVVASRLVWALGYHQVPSYFVERWIAVTHAKGAVLGGARFRPDALGLKSLGTWSWQQNPFVGTQPYRGLLVLMMILNSTDLKNDNNALYEVTGRAREEASRWYVVKDLGATLGETGRFDPRRADVASFEREPFIRSADGDRVRFGYRGRHRELIDGLSAADVRWTCERLARLTDRQWRDAFRAGNFSDEEIDRYVARLRQKIDEGLTLR